MAELEDNNQEAEEERRRQEEQKQREYNEATGQARIIAQENAKKEKAKQDSVTSKSGALSEMRKGLSRLLSLAWELLIPSWGFSILIIDAFVVLNRILPGMFPKLGEEWVNLMVPKEVQKTNPEKVKQVTEKIAMMENGACCCLNGCCGIVWLTVITLICLLIYVLNNKQAAMIQFPAEAVRYIWTSIFG
jgi:hypothetical protein